MILCKDVATMAIAIVASFNAISTICIAIAIVTSFHATCMEYQLYL